ncbi:MAG: ubiquitin-conjugating enzyme E2 [Promethearchaeota archaeon]
MPELPLEIWKDRIKNEIKSLANLDVLEPNSVIYQENSVELIIKIKSLGFILKEDPEGLDLIPQINHRIFLKLNRSFPYPGGIDFSWYSNIFHPNIHPVELSSGEKGTGYICLNVLKKWSRLSDLETIVKALKMLVKNPNPDDPLNYPICLEATEFFKKNTMEELRTQYQIEESEIEDDDDDIIIIDD